MASVRRRLRDPAGMVALLLALGLFAAVTYAVMKPVFADPSLYGRYDWDAALSQRYAVVLSLRRYHELPWYDPWLCGGFPAWGFSEGAENFVSPFLPLYLLLPIGWAFRFEILGSALLSIAFTYLAATRVTRSIALRAAVVVAAALNGRWALQMGAGHLWHLQFAWMPLAYYFYDRAIGNRGGRGVLGAAVSLAMMVYMGGIYPLPYTILLLGSYGTLLCIDGRTWRPLVKLVGIGALSAALAAPKLFPVLALMRRFPGLVDSPEAIGPAQTIAMLTARDQSFERFPVRVPAYGWHEWGIYVGWAGVAIMVVALLLGKVSRERALSIVGVVFFALGLGAFARFAPWTLLHRAPIFSSLHVPSRFFYPAVFVLMLAGASVLGRWSDRALRHSRWLDVALLVPIAWMGLDIAAQGGQAVSDVFVLAAPTVVEEPHFAQTAKPKYDYSRPEWTGATLLLMEQNLGRMQSLCYGPRNYGEGLRTGAIAREAPDYRGEAYVAGGSGEAHIVHWTPSGADVAFDHTAPGALVVYNTNWDPSWQADGGPAAKFHDAVAAQVDAGSGMVHFRFLPIGLSSGLWVLAIAFVLLLAGAVVRRWIA